MTLDYKIEVITRKGKILEKVSKIRYIFGNASLVEKIEIPVMNKKANTRYIAEKNGYVIKSRVPERNEYGKLMYERMYEWAIGVLTALQLKDLRFAIGNKILELVRPEAVVIDVSAKYKIVEIVTFQKKVNGKPINRDMFSNIQELFRILGIGKVNGPYTIWSIDDFLERENKIYIVDEENFFSYNYQIIAKLEKLAELEQQINDIKRYEDVLSEDISKLVKMKVDIKTTLDSLRKIEKAYENARRIIADLW